MFLYLAFVCAFNYKKSNHLNKENKSRLHSFICQHFSPEPKLSLLYTFSFGRWALITSIIIEI